MKILQITGCNMCPRLMGIPIYKEPESTNTAQPKISGYKYKCGETGAFIVIGGEIPKTCPLGDADEVAGILTQIHNYAYQLGQYYPGTDKFYNIEELRILGKAMVNKIKRIIGVE